MRSHSIPQSSFRQRRRSDASGDDVPRAKTNTRVRKVRNPWRPWLEDFGRAVLCELLAKFTFEKVLLPLSLLVCLLLSSSSVRPKPTPLEWHLDVADLGQFVRDDLTEMLSPSAWLDDGLRAELYPGTLPPYHNHRPNGRHKLIRDL
jgi:hypothetical protein